MTQVGQTISSKEFNSLYPVGTTLSANEFNQKYGAMSSTSATNPKETTPALQKVGEFTGTQALGKGFGMTIAKPDVSKLQAGQEQQQSEMFNKLMAQIKSAKQRGDSESVQRLVKAGQKAGFDMSVIGQFAKEAPTSKQVIASAIQTAATPLAFGKIGGIAAVPTRTIPRLTKFGALGAIESGAQAYGENKNPSQILSSAGMGAAIGGLAPEVMGKVIGTGFKGLGKIYKTLLSVSSGVPGEAIQRAFQKPKTIGNAVKLAKITKNDILGIQGKLAESVDKFQEKVSTSYGQRLEESIAKNPKFKANSKNIVDSIKKGLTKFGVNLEEKNPFATSSISDSTEVKKLSQMINEIKGWKDWSAKGTKTLEQRIGNTTKGVIKQAKMGVASGKFSSATTEIYNAIKKTLPQEIREADTQYSKMSNLVAELKQEFLSKGGENKLANIFGKNKTRLLKLLEEAKEVGGDELADEIAGSLFEPLLADYLRVAISGGAISTAGGFAAGGFSLPAMIGGLISASPRATGIQARFAGRIASGIKKTRPVTEPALRQTLINLLK